MLSAGHDIGVQASFLEIFSEGELVAGKKKKIYIYFFNVLIILRSLLPPLLLVFLRGVEVCGETVLKVVGNRSDELKWSDYGFSLEVPGGALPFGETANVAVKVILSGQFQLPEHYQQISAIYYISASEDFLEEVIVNHQYCAVTRSEEERSRLRIIIAKSPQNKLPYRFRVQKGVFNPDPQYASIKMKQFSKPFMVGAIAPETIERSYIALKYKQVPRSNFILSIAHNLKPVWKVLVHVQSCVKIYYYYYLLLLTPSLLVSVCQGTPSRMAVRRGTDNLL